MENILIGILISIVAVQAQSEENTVDVARTGVDQVKLLKRISESNGVKLNTVLYKMEKQEQKLQQIETKLEEVNSKFENITELLHLKFNALESTIRNTSDTEVFELIGSKYYYIEEHNPLNWFAAYQKCSELGAHLCSVEDWVELYLLWKRMGFSNFWLDINDLVKQGEFVSSTTGQKPNYLAWHTDEPSGNGHCVEVRQGEEAVSSENPLEPFSDSDCQEKKGFICERSNEG